MNAADRIWIGAVLIAAPILNVPFLPPGLIGFGVGSLLVGVAQLHRARRDTRRI